MEIGRRCHSVIEAYGDYNDPFPNDYIIAELYL